MFRKLAVAALAVAALGVSASTAPAATSVVRCSGKTYGGVDRFGFPTVSRLRAINLPRRTDGYAPRCLVAESVAGAIQDRHGRTGFVTVGGARWRGGTWRVTRTIVTTSEGAFARFTARKGQRQRITFDGGS